MSSFANQLRSTDTTIERRSPHEPSTTKSQRHRRQGDRAHILAITIRQCDAAMRGQQLPCSVSIRVLHGPHHVNTAEHSAPRPTTCDNGRDLNVGFLPRPWKAAGIEPQCSHGHVVAKNRPSSGSANHPASVVWPHATQKLRPSEHRAHCGDERQLERVRRPVFKVQPLSLPSGFIPWVRDCLRGDSSWEYGNGAREHQPANDTCQGGRWHPASSMLRFHSCHPAVCVERAQSARPRNAAPGWATATSRDAQGPDKARLACPAGTVPAAAKVKQPVVCKLPMSCDARKSAGQRAEKSR
jgi:hypothetical protein